MTTTIPKESLELLKEKIGRAEKFRTVLVVRSKRTGKDITFRLKGFQSETHGYSVFVGFERSYDTYTDCARLVAGSVAVFNKFKAPLSEYVLGAKAVLSRIASGRIDNLLEVADVHHTGSCIICNRKLTDLNSIQRGVGASCAKG